MAIYAHRKPISTLTGIFACLVILASCGNKKSEAPKSQVKAADKKDEGIGPFEVNVPLGAGGYRNTFQAKINQAEGKVEYFITQEEDATLMITSSAAAVTSCAGDSVELLHFWAEDGKKESLIGINKGEHFRARKGIRGLLVVAFRGIARCDSLDYQIELRQFEQINPQVMTFQRSKAVKCSRMDGAEFQMNYPQIRFTTDENGFPKFTPGTICYGEKRTKRDAYQFQWFYGSGQAVYQNGQNQTIQLYTNAGPTAYMEFGFYPSYDSPLAGRGKFSEWYPWGDLRKRSHDMECVFYADAFEECK